MRNLTTELKVGLLILAGVATIVYSSVVVTGWRPGQADTYSLDIHFDNAAGLLVGSPVQTAGVKVGQVQDISLADGQARVRVGIFRRYALFADSTASIKSIGILGDKYVEVRPGTPGQAPLQNGDTIVLVLPGADLDSLIDSLSVILGDVRSVTGALRQTLGEEAGRERLDNILNQISRATSDLSRITDATNRQIDAILNNLTRFTANLDTIAAENKDALKSSIDNLALFSGDLKDLTGRNRDTLEAIFRNLDVFAQALATDGTRIASDLRELLADNKESLSRAITNLDRSFVKLDQTMSSIESVSQKMDKGEGSLGKLINDETTVEELNGALAGLNRFLTDAERIKLDLGGHVEFLADQGEYKSYLDVRLQPLKDRYYLLQLIDNPRGKVSEQDVITTTNGVTTTSNEVVVKDQFQISLIIAQRYYDTVLKGGLMENTFGLGVEQLFGSADQYRIGLDVWDFGGDLGPHVKLTGYWRFFSNAFLVIGGDDLASDREEFRDAFFGIGLHFNEDSLKPLLSSVPLGP